ncbi:hypothetical protein [Hymenobacter bucti]|uniref:Enhanced intracellular survival protein domain-containing protein n=1 Tax=Hymenobacter bucti TaxID=1844114 RepID=A0ABW4QPH1_9BACT
MPFRNHLTTGALPQSKLAHFVAACESLSAKPLVIELARGTCVTQPVPGKVVQAPDLLAALALAATDAAYLGNRHLAGFDAVVAGLPAPPEQGFWHNLRDLF